MNYELSDLLRSSFHTQYRQSFIYVLIIKKQNNLQVHSKEKYCRMTTIQHSAMREQKDGMARVKSDTVETQFEIELFKHSIRTMEQSQFMSSLSVFDDDQAADEEKDFAPEVFYELGFHDVGLADLSTKSTPREADEQENDLEAGKQKVDELVDEIFEVVELEAEKRK